MRQDPYLGATIDEIGWVVTGYIISNVIVIPMTSWLSDRFGPTPVLAVAMVVVVLANDMLIDRVGLTEMIAETFAGVEQVGTAM